MKKIQQSDVLEMGLEEFVENMGEIDFKNAEETVALGLQIPRSTKLKYDKIQNQTKRWFGRILKQMIVKAIDKVPLKEDQAS